ncbi:unnamed protein product, partial [Protopolystoma xenopodis]
MDGNDDWQDYLRASYESAASHVLDFHFSLLKLLSRSLHMSGVGALSFNPTPAAPSPAGTNVGGNVIVGTGYVYSHSVPNDTAFSTGFASINERPTHLSSRPRFSPLLQPSPLFSQSPSQAAGEPGCFQRVGDTSTSFINPLTRNIETPLTHTPLSSPISGGASSRICRFFSSKRLARGDTSSIDLVLTLRYVDHRDSFSTSANRQD